ncbi:universal stress protein [Nocardioides sp. URHA0020]|uniref:universal stress protein n=1 Tax=Nocardioides sp. URHA0020 TaxID=1380392 RepID=UPI00048DE219|nr:universal stress protein [Nocardioides sp. URHA0020]
MDLLPAPVVVAVGRHGSPTALEHGAEEAMRHHRDLHLVHAAGPDGDGEAVLAVAVARVSALVGGLVTVTSALVDAPPVAAVVEAAVDAGLVVVGRCPESRRTHPYVRSVTGGVAARVRAPVVSVPDSWMAGDAPHRVVVGVDDPDDSEVVLREAFAAAWERDAQLTVISTWWRPPGSDQRALAQISDPAWPERLQEGIDRALVDLLAAYDEVLVDVHVRNARPGDALIEASHDAALMVLGRHDPQLPTGSSLGPVARSVVRESACPVLLAAPRAAHRVHRRDRSPAQLA